MGDATAAGWELRLQTLAVKALAVQGLAKRVSDSGYTVVHDVGG
jgi:hypothetical protein